MEIVVAEEKLLERDINRIVDQAGRLSRDKKFENIWRDIYEPAKQALAELGLDTITYQNAVAALTEAMRV